MRHRFSTKIIQIVHDLYNQAAIGCRTIARVLQVFAKQILPRAPHHTTIHQWLVRSGCHSLQSSLEQAEDWVAIGDLTVSVGKMKCLAITGVRMSSLEQKENFNLTHKDVVVLGLYPIEKSDSTFVKEALEDAAKRVGGSLLAAVFDQGSDVKKGALLFQQEHPEVKILHDIAHKLSNVVERALKNDAKWKKYIRKLNMTRRRALQTELAALMPAKQREKARFMDIGFLVDWPGRVLKSKAEGHLLDISEERFQDYFGWIKKFDAALDVWGLMVGIVETIKEVVRTYGLSEAAYSYLKSFFEEAPIEGRKLQAFISDSLEAVREEVEKLDEGQTLPCSTEVLESVFGKYKAINEGIQGITGNVLGICTFVGPERSEEELKRVMEQCSVRKGQEWVKKKVGNTVPYFRKKFFPGSKRTNFDVCFGAG